MGEHSKRRRKVKRRIDRRERRFLARRDRRRRAAHRHYQHEQGQEAERLANEGRFRDRHAELIETLPVVGHQPEITTGSPWDPRVPGWETSMRCAKCGLRFRGRVLSRWFGLSPRRPCRDGHPSPPM
jgi:hypothetical protein